MSIPSFLRHYGFQLLLLAFALALPLFVPDRYIFGIVILSGVWAIATLSLNLILGYTGQASLAHGGFFGIGAYGVGILTKAGLSFWLALPTAALLAALLGFLLGLPTLRSRGSYFAISTLCLGVIIYIVAGNWMDLTGGYTGLLGIPKPNPIGPLAFDTQTSQYYLVLAFLLLTLFVMHRLVSSLVGYSFMAIRNNELLASAVGINTFHNKVLSFVIANFFAALAGGLYAVLMGSISPSAATYNTTFILLVYLLLGGAATLAGPVLGAFAIPVLLEYLQFISEYRLLVFGALLVVVIIYWPHGLMGAFTSLKQKTQQANQARKAGAPSALGSAEPHQTV